MSSSLYGIDNFLNLSNRQFFPSEGVWDIFLASKKITWSLSLNGWMIIPSNSHNFFPGVFLSYTWMLAGTVNVVSFVLSSLRTLTQHLHSCAWSSEPLLSFNNRLTSLILLFLPLVQKTHFSLLIVGTITAGFSLNK